MKSIGPWGWVNPLEAATLAQVVPRNRRGDPTLELLEWVVGIGVVVLLGVLGSAWALRVRREAVDGELDEGDGEPADLMEIVREAYFEGEIDTEEYQQVRRKLNPAARDEPPPPRARDADASQLNTSGGDAHHPGPD